MKDKQLLMIDKEKFESAYAVIQALIQGIHPETKEPLAGDCVVQDVRILRSLLTVEECLKTVRVRVERRSQLPPNTGRAWSEEEDAMLKGAFRDGKTLEEIASSHQRSVAAIEGRLEKLGLITAEERTTGRFVAATTASRRSVGEAWRDGPHDAEANEENR